MPLKDIPEPKLITLDGGKIAPPAESVDIRELRVKEFLQARSLAPKSEKAYRQDIKYFLEWSNISWVEVAPRDVAQFKDFLIYKKKLAPASVRRVLGTLKNFYNWMFRSGYVKSDPTLAVDLPKLKEPGANNLSDKIVADIFGAASETTYPERNLAIVGVLLHGLRASEVYSLNFGDYDGECLEVKVAKADSVGTVPLEQWCINLVENYLDWRRQMPGFNKGGESSEAPLFTSCSWRNKGERISYDTISKLCYQLKKETGHDFHAHQFRHTFGTNLILAGINPYHAMTLMRHKSVSNFRRYTKAADSKAAIKEFHGVSQKGSILRPEL